MQILLAVVIAVSFLDLSEARLGHFMSKVSLRWDFALSDLDRDNASSKAEYMLGFHATDVNSDGKTAVEEYSYAESCFPKLDIDGDGFASETEIREMFRNQVANGDGYVSQNEWKEYCINVRGTCADSKMVDHSISVQLTKIKLWKEMIRYFFCCCRLPRGFGVH